MGSVKDAHINTHHQLRDLMDEKNTQLEKKNYEVEKLQLEVVNLRHTLDTSKQQDEDLIG